MGYRRSRRAGVCHPDLVQIANALSKANKASCKSLKPLTSKARSPMKNHEEIASLCLKSKLFGGEEGFTKSEREWAQSEVGEGVEEVWERAVSHLKTQDDD